MKMDDGTIKRFRVAFWIATKNFGPDRFIVDRMFETFEQAKQFTSEINGELHASLEWSIDVIYRAPEEKK
jgi:hypothetical protein